MPARIEVRGFANQVNGDAVRNAVRLRSSRPIEQALNQSAVGGIIPLELRFGAIEAYLFEQFAQPNVRSGLRQNLTRFATEDFTQRQGEAQAIGRQMMDAVAIPLNASDIQAASQVIGALGQRLQGQTVDAIAPGRRVEADRNMLFLSHFPRLLVQKIDQELARPAPAPQSAAGKRRQELMALRQALINLSQPIGTVAESLQRMSFRDGAWPQGLESLRTRFMRDQNDLTRRDAAKTAYTQGAMEAFAHIDHPLSLERIREMSNVQLLEQFRRMFDAEQPGYRANLAEVARGIWFFAPPGYATILQQQPEVREYMLRIKDFHHFVVRSLAQPEEAPAGFDQAFVRLAGVLTNDPAVGLRQFINNIGGELLQDYYGLYPGITFPIFTFARYLEEQGVSNETRNSVEFYGYYAILHAVLQNTLRLLPQNETTERVSGYFATMYDTLLAQDATAVVHRKDVVQMEGAIQGISNGVFLDTAANSAPILAEVRGSLWAQVRGSERTYLPFSPAGNPVAVRILMQSENPRSVFARELGITAITLQAYGNPEEFGMTAEIETSWQREDGKRLVISAVVAPSGETHILIKPGQINDTVRDMFATILHVAIADDVLAAHGERSVSAGPTEPAGDGERSGRRGISGTLTRKRYYGALSGTTTPIQDESEIASLAEQKPSQADFIPAHKQQLSGAQSFVERVNAYREVERLLAQGEGDPTQLQDQLTSLTHQLRVMLRLEEPIEGEVLPILFRPSTTPLPHAPEGVTRETIALTLPVSKVPGAVFGESEDRVVPLCTWNVGYDANASSGAPSAAQQPQTMGEYVRQRFLYGAHSYLARLEGLFRGFHLESRAS